MKKNEEQKLSQINDYLNRLNNRIAYVEKQSENLKKKIDSRDNKIITSHKSINEEISTLREKTAETKKILDDNKRFIRLLVAKFKDIIKQEDMDKLKEKIELWGPEKLITRDEMKKII